MKVYLSLPISGYDEQERRTFAARTCGFLNYEHEDWEIINPFMIADRLRKERLERGDFAIPTYNELMDADIQILRTCEMAVFCPGWHFSEGCQAEMLECRWHGLEVKFLTDSQSMCCMNLMDI